MINMEHENTKHCLNRQIRQYEDRFMNGFKPTRKFYLTVKIGQKRFGKLLRGEDSPKVTELERLAEFFRCGLTDLIY